MAPEVQGGRPPPRLGGGRFQVVDTLGDGGTATVYLAWDGTQKLWCALKALHHRFLKDQEMLRRFAQEAQALQLLRHPHIPKLYHEDMEAVPPYMVMELARCGSTMDWIKKHGKMPPAMAVDVLFQVCQALAEAHAAGIVHRDVKPHNFLLDELGHCKLTDFGIARVTDNTSFTTTGSQIGTFSFMAPEQRSDTKSVDHRADIYSVGASLYTLLTAKTSAELFVADTEDELLAELPASFRPVIIRSTRYKPEERYASILELQTDLMNALSRIPPTQAAYPPLVRPLEPLADGPPAVLVGGRRFDDLEKSLALDTNQPTFVEKQPQKPAARLTPEPAALRAPASTPTHEPRSPRSIPYYMPTRPSQTGLVVPAEAKRPAPLAQRPSNIPSYVDDSELGALKRVEEAKIASEEASIAQAAAAETAARQAAARRAEEEESNAVPRTVVALTLSGVLLCVLAMSSVVYGAVTVQQAALTSMTRAEELTSTLRAESSVVYDLSVDRAMFEELYTRFHDNQGMARLEAALLFVEQLDRTVGSGSELDPVLEPKVRRLQKARDEYVSARGDWVWTSEHLPGSLAVGLRLATPP